MKALIVTYTPHFASGTVGSRQRKTLTDWYDFADWIKQTNLDGCSIEVHAWVYAD